MPMNVATMMATFGVNTAPLAAGLAESRTMIGASTAGLALAAAGVGAVVAGVGVIATKMAGDFQAGLTSLVTGAGEAQKNLGLVSAGILQMSKDTGTSTQQLIAGMYMIESGGFHGAAGLKILQAAAEGAKVGSADLGTVADTVDTILKNFGEHGAMTASQATNALITTVANGKTHMEDLANSLSGVLPAGAAAGLGLKDVLGAMSTLTGVGLDAANSATYLRQMIISLEAPSSGSKKALAGIGITSDELAAKLKQGLPQALQFIKTQLTDHGIREGSAAYVAAIREISGGTRQMQGMLNLMQGNIGQTGTHLDTFAANVAKIGTASKTTGTSVTGWALVQGTFNQKMAVAAESVKALFIELGEKLLPVATKFAGWLGSTAVPAIQNFATWITGSSDSVKKWRPIILIAAIAIGGALVAAFVAWAASAAAAAVATIAATWPILAIGAAIALLVAGLIWAYNNIEPFRNAVQAAANGARIMWQDTVQLVNRLGGLGNILKVVGIIALVALTGPLVPLILLITHWKQFTELLGHFKDRLGDLMGVIGDFFGSVFGAIGGFAAHWIGVWVSLVAKTVLMVQNFASGILTKIGQFKDDVLAHIAYLVITTIAKFLYLRQQAIQHAKDLATGFMSALAALPGKLLTLGETLIKNLAQGIKNGASALGNAIKSLPGIGGIAGGIGNMLPHFALGGVMGQSGLALVGEQGPEIVNLTRGDTVTPVSKTQSGLSQLPASLAGALGGGASGQTQTIIVQLHADGKKIAQVVVPHIHTVIRNATGQRGF